MAVTDLIVFCYLSGEIEAVPAGRFTHDSATGIGFFQYGRRYLERPNALPLDYAALPLGVTPLPVAINGGLYGAFRDSSPDYWGRLVMASRMKCAPEALTEIDYLGRANATRVGNLDFREAVDQPEPILAPPQFQDIADLIDAAQMLEKGGAIDERIRLLLEQGSSLGGGRPKCTVQLDGQLWLAKFPSRHDSINIPAVEYATMKLAGICGLNVPDIRLVSVGAHDVFLIQRFDRVSESSATCCSRRGFMSSLSLAEWDERDRDRWSYTTVAEKIRRYSISPGADLHELYKRIAFNIAVRNTDDHPRNHGFLLEREGVCLSPLYDVVPTLTHRGVGTEFFLAMTIGQEGRLAQVDNLCSSASAFGFSQAEGREIWDAIDNKVMDEWRRVCIESGLSMSNVQMLEPSFVR